MKRSDELEAIREQWLIEKPSYEDYAESIVLEMQDLLRTSNITAHFDSRIKEDASLLKKALYKEKSYDEITDKAGARIIVQFLSDIKKCDKLIIDYYGDRIIKRDDKTESSDETTFGYLSLHYDIASSDKHDAMICELQLRTLCQNTWADLAHILTYKPGVELPKEIKREVNSLSALLEIADKQFQSILIMIDKLPVDSPVRILNAISGFFYTNICAWYDSKMSYYFLDKINALYDDENIIEKIENFIKRSGKEIIEIADKRKDILMFSQPEIVVILERLESCPHLLQDYWRFKYAIDDLENIANAWGKSLD